MFNITDVIINIKTHNFDTTKSELTVIFTFAYEINGKKTFIYFQYAEKTRE